MARLSSVFMASSNTGSAFGAATMAAVFLSAFCGPEPALACVAAMAVATQIPRTALIETARLTQPCCFIIADLTRLRAWDSPVLRRVY